MDHNVAVFELVLAARTLLQLSRLGCRHDVIAHNSALKSVTVAAAAAVTVAVAAAVTVAVAAAVTVVAAAAVTVTVAPVTVAPFTVAAAITVFIVVCFAGCVPL